MIEPGLVPERVITGASTPVRLFRLVGPLFRLGGALLWLAGAPAADRGGPTAARGALLDMYVCKCTLGSRSTPGGPHRWGPPEKKSDQFSLRVDAPANKHKIS